MGNVQDIGWEKKVIMGLDSVVIRSYVDGIKGGVVLDVSDFTEDEIKTGHVIIKKNKIFKPMPVSNGAYGSLPEGYSYAGICVTTKPKSEPIVGVMTIGEVNDVAAPFDLATIKAAVKTAIPTLVFDND